MKQTTPSVGVTLIEVLATRRALDTIPNILQAAVGANPAVRAAAMTALGQLAGPEHIPGMVRGVLRAQKGAERAAAEKAVMFVCGRISDSQRRAEPLIAARDKLKPADRTALLSTLGRVGGSESLKIVAAAVSNRNPALHSAGIRALSNWPNASVASRLIKLAKTDKHPNHRTTALRALIRIAPLPDGRPDDQKLDLLQTAMAMCQRDAERNLVLQRAAAIRLPETLRFISPYMDQQRYAQQACATVVELAHHRNLREPNKAEFDRALDKVILTSKDTTVVERANRYKKGQTWVRPRTPKPK
jgi:HEAT repeat protein